MKLFVFVLAIAVARGKVVIEKWEIQVDPKFASVKNEVRDATFMSVDTHCLVDADDVVVSTQSKLQLHSFLRYFLLRFMQQRIQKLMEFTILSFDRTPSIFVRSTNMKIHWFSSCMKKFWSSEMLQRWDEYKFLLIRILWYFFFSSQACPLKKGAYYYLHDFTIDEAKFPMPLPEGEFRLDVNASVIVGGVDTHAYSSELFFKTVKDWWRVLIRTIFNVDLILQDKK